MNIYIQLVDEINRMELPFIVMVMIFTCILIYCHADILNNIRLNLDSLNKQYKPIVKVTIVLIYIISFLSLILLWFLLIKRLLTL